MPRRAQEEMVGFVLIMVIVAILLVIFIGFSLRTSQKSEVESYEVESFIRSTLQYTTDCKDNLGYLTVTKLIEGCISSEKCLDDRDMCLVLTRDINELVGVSWRIQNRPIVGYEFNILSENEEIIPAIVQGNSTNNYKAGFETFSRGGSPILVRLKVYY